jgi:hypothetical protein
VRAVVAPVPCSLGRCWSLTSSGEVLHTRQVMSAQWYDANVSLPGCDKNMPGTLMAMGRLNRPSLMVYGGTIKPGHSATGATLDIVSAFQSYGPSTPSAVPVTARYQRDARFHAVRLPSSIPARSSGRCLPVMCVKKRAWSPPTLSQTCDRDSLSLSPD